MSSQTQQQHHQRQLLLLSLNHFKDPLSYVSISLEQPYIFHPCPRFFSLILLRFCGQRSLVHRHQSIHRFCLGARPEKDGASNIKLHCKIYEERCRPCDGPIPTAMTRKRSTSHPHPLPLPNQKKKKKKHRCHRRDNHNKIIVVVAAVEEEDIIRISTTNSIHSTPISGVVVVAEEEEEEDISSNNNIKDVAVLQETIAISHINTSSSNTPTIVLETGSKWPRHRRVSPMVRI